MFPVAYATMERKLTMGVSSRKFDHYTSPGVVRKIAGRVDNVSEIAKLHARCLFSKEVLVDSSSRTIVSMTSHGNRIGTCHLALESIGCAAKKPGRLILWLDEPETIQNLPKHLTRMRERGLEIFQSSKIGPHSKYYPCLEIAQQTESLLVTADDDMLYPADWLLQLLRTNAASPNTFIGYRARRIGIEKNQIASYASWDLVRDVNPGHTVFVTAVAGALHPYSMISALLEAGESFRQHSIRADDIWVNNVALRNGIRARQVFSSPKHFRLIPRTTESSLEQVNVHQGGNDRMLSHVYSEADIKCLQDELLVLGQH